MLDISCGLSVRQTIHMKCQALFFSEKEKIKFKTSSAVAAISVLRDKNIKKFTEFIFSK